MVARPLRKFESSTNIPESDPSSGTQSSSRPELIHSHLPFATHWALRVEVNMERYYWQCSIDNKAKIIQSVERQGDINDPNTWEYYAIVGKLDPNGIRKFQLDLRRFQPTHYEWYGSTKMSPGEVLDAGISLFPCG